MQADTTSLPALGKTWGDGNPYRGNPQAAEVGRSVFSQACARCHGAEADGTGMGAPDLRRFGGLCRPIADAALRARCTSDADDFFRRSVLNGKVRVGIVHMPAWEPYLSQEQVWAVKTYLESRSSSR